jgi:hypothetical protein
VIVGLSNLNLDCLFCPLNAHNIKRGELYPLPGDSHAPIVVKKTSGLRMGSVTGVYARIKSGLVLLSGKYIAPIQSLDHPITCSRRRNLILGELGIVYSDSHVPIRSTGTSRLRMRETQRA